MLRKFTFKQHTIILGICVLFLGIMVPLTSFAQSASSEVHLRSYSLFGDAAFVRAGNQRAVQLRSSIAVIPGYGGMDFQVPKGLTFAGIQNLSADYNFTQNSCGGGSPRFQINIDGKNAFVYIGPPPNYTLCAKNVWLNTGNLATPSSFVDTSQLPGGKFYDTFASADAKYGTHVVTGIQIVVDGDWFFPSDSVQTVLIENANITINANGAPDQ